MQSDLAGLPQVLQQSPDIIAAQPARTADACLPEQAHPALSVRLHESYHGLRPEQICADPQITLHHVGSQRRAEGNKCESLFKWAVCECQRIVWLDYGIHR